MFGLRSFELAHTLPMKCFRNSNMWLAETSCWHLWTGATPLLISCHPSTITLLPFSSPPSTVHIHLPKRYHHFPLRIVTLKPYQPLGLCHPVFAAPKIVVERVRKEYILLHSTIPAWLSYQTQALICGNLRRTPRAAEVDWNYTSPPVESSKLHQQATTLHFVTAETHRQDCQGCWWCCWTCSHLDRSLSLSAGIEHLALYNCFQIHSGQNLI